MCAHRTAQCAAGYVSTQRRCGGTTGPLDLLRTKLSPLDRCRWTLIRLAQRQDSLATTARGTSEGKSKDGKGKGRGKKGDKTKDQKGGRGKKGDKTQDQKPISNPEQFQRILRIQREVVTRACRLQETHRRRQVGGAAAASADSDRDVAAVMEVDDAVMGTEDDETSMGWCFGVTSLCAAVGSTCSLLLDSGRRTFVHTRTAAPRTQGCATE